MDRIEDRWLIRPVAGDDSQISINMSVEVKFVKSTFFKKIIENRSKGDTLGFYQK